MLFVETGVGRLAKNGKKREHEIVARFSILWIDSSLTCIRPFPPCVVALDVRVRRVIAYLACLWKEPHEGERGSKSPCGRKGRRRKDKKATFLMERTE